MKTIITLVFALLVGQPAFAAKVITVKGQRVLLDAEGETFSTGDRIGLRNAQGKAIGLVVVEKSTGNRVIGRIQRGSAVRGATGALIGGSAPARSKSQASSPRGGRRISANSSYGILGGLTMTNQTAKTSDGGTSVIVEGKGTSFNVLGFYQMPISDSIGLRISGGLETINVTGTVNNKEFKADIKYLGLNSTIKYNYYTQPKMELWAGAGLSFLVNMSETQNIYQTSPKMLNSILFSLGGDIRMGKNSYLPLQFDYGYFQSTKTVETTQMMFRAGWAWNF